jgi:quaternary ammonium compound-resistance protein SugE
MNAWIALLVAGIFEIGFTTSMKLSQNFSKVWYLVPFLLCAVASFSCLAYAMKSIPLGTSYAVWTGIGAAGTAVVGMLFFGDQISLARILFLLLLIGSIIGLKLVSSDL